MTPGALEKDPLWLLTEAVCDAMVVIDRTGKVVRWNRAATHMLGFTAEEAADRAIHDLIIPPAGQSPICHDVLTGAATRPGTRPGGIHDFVARHKDGGEVPVEITLSPLMLDGRRLVIGILRGISERKATERALQESETRYRRLIEDWVQGIVIHRDFQPLYANKAYAEMHGFATPEEVQDSSLLDTVIPPERHDSARASHARLMQGDHTTIMQSRVQQTRRDGRTIWVDVTERRIDWMGMPASQISTVDVTAEVETEASMMRQADQARETMETMDQGLLRVDRNLNIIAFNHRYLDLMMMPAERVRVGQPLADLLVFDALRQISDPDGILDYVEQRLIPLRERRAHCYEHRLLDGRIIEVRGQPTPDGGGLRTYTDVTQRHRVEQAQRTLLETTPTPLVVTHPGDETIIYANPAAYELLALEPGADGSPACATDVYVDPADRQHLVRNLTEWGRVDGLELRLKGKDGLPLWVLVSSRCFTYQGRAAVLSAINVITQRKHLEQELTHAKERAEKALADLTRTQEELIETAKLASLGSMVAGIAHELNTPIGVVLTAISHLGDQATDVERLFHAGELQRGQLNRFLATVRDAAALALSNIERAATLVNSFKQLAADQASEQRRPIDLATYLGEVMTSMAPKMRQEGHQLRLDCPAGIALDSYPGPLFQVVTNIVMNATIHAFDPGQPGRITMAAERMERGVILTIADNGKGMSEEVRRHIFEPFFTTRRSAGGTGLGLHIVHTMVTRTLRGRIRCDSQPGAGTRFTIWLPRVA